MKRLILKFFTYKNVETIKNIISFFLYYSGLSHLLSFVTQKGASILVFHSVCDSSVFEDNRISPSFFESLVKYVTSRYKVVPIGKIIEKIDNKEDIPSDWISLSFDDGYADNYINALPILKKYNAVGTFFITLDVIHKQKVFFYDRIQWIIDHTEFERLELRIDQQDYSFILKNQKQKDDAVLRIVLGIREKRQHEREEVIDALVKKCGIKNPESINSASYYLTAKQVKSLHTAGMEIGSHTLSHCNLKAASPQELDNEIVQSKKQLESIIGDQINSFSYPFGKKTTYDETVIRCLQKAGYSHAVTTQFGKANKDTKIYELPRFGVRESQLSRFKVNLLGIPL